MGFRLGGVAGPLEVASREADFRVTDPGPQLPPGTFLQLHSPEPPDLAGGRLKLRCLSGVDLGDCKLLCAKAK